MGNQIFMRTPHLTYIYFQLITFSIVTKILTIYLFSECSFINFSNPRSLCLTFYMREISFFLILEIDLLCRYIQSDCTYYMYYMFRYSFNSWHINSFQYLVIVLYFMMDRTHLSAFICSVWLLKYNSIYPF